MDFATCKEKLREQIKENDRLCLLLRIKNNEYSLLENKITKLHKEIERLREALKPFAKTALQQKESK